MPTTPTAGGTRLADFVSNSNSPTGFSPGTQTLATVRREAISEQRQTGRRETTRTRTGGQTRPRRRIGRVMKEENFESMPWTRTFVSGLVEPKWNKHMIYCQICKCNVSIRAKGTKEILRHYATERHLRKDQRWRYEYFTIEDPLTKRLQCQVRSRDGKILASAWTSATNCRSTTMRWLVATTWPPPHKIAPECKYLISDFSFRFQGTFKSFAYYGSRLVRSSITKRSSVT